jgi:hypothetical protein
MVVVAAMIPDLAEDHPDRPAMLLTWALMIRRHRSFPPYQLPANDWI